MENRPPASSVEDTTDAALPHQTLTVEQHKQLRAQTFVHADLVNGKPLKWDHMIWAFGQPAKGQRHIWEDPWRAAVDRWQHQRSPSTGLETPNSCRIDSCATERCCKDTAVCKTTVSEPHSSKSHPNTLQHDGGQEATQGEQYSSHDEPVGGCEHAQEDICCAAVDRLPNPTSPMAGLETPTSSRIDSCMTGQGRKDTAVCKTMVSEPRTSSLSKKKTGKKIKDIQKSCPNSPCDGNEDGAKQSSKKNITGNEDGAKRSSKKNITGNEDGAKRSSKKNITGNTVIGTSHVHCSDDGFSGLRLGTRDKHINSLVEDLTEQEICAICGKDGQPQKCSTCFLAIHLSCFAPSVRFSDCGGCPVCFYNKATEALEKAQKTQNEASKNLSAFCAQLLAKRHSEQSTKRQQRAANSAVDLNGCGTSRMKPNQQSEAANISRKHEGLGQQKTTVTSDAFPEEVATEKTSFCPNSENAEAHEENSNSNSSHEVPHSSHYRCNPIANHNIGADRENSLMNSHNCEIYGERGATSGRNMGRRKVRFEEKETVVSNSYKKALGCQDQLMPSPSSRRYYAHPPEKALGCQDQFMPSPSSRRHYAYPPEHYSNLRTPARSDIASSGRRSFASTARRTRVIWTEAEEAALREAVAKFAPKDKRQISWIQIHDYGRDVFHQARRPQDLMRKWDYMRKSEALKNAGFRV